MLKEHAIADISDVFDDELKSKLVGGITENAAAQPYGDGKVYLAPIIYTPTGLWYNKDMFGEGNTHFQQHGMSSLHLVNRQKKMELHYLHIHNQVILMQQCIRC